MILDQKSPDLMVKFVVGGQTDIVTHRLKKPLLKRSVKEHKKVNFVLYKLHLVVTMF